MVSNVEMAVNGEKSPGRPSVAPYASSAGEWPVSALALQRIEIRIRRMSSVERKEVE